MKQVGIVHRTLDPSKTSEYRTNWLTLSAMIPLLGNNEIVLFVAEIDNLSERLRDLLPETVKVVGVPYSYEDKRLHHPLTKRWVHRKWQKEVRLNIVQNFGKNYFNSVLIGSSLNWDNYVDFSAISNKIIIGPLDGGRRLILQRSTVRSDLFLFVLWTLLDFLNRVYFRLSRTFNKVLKNANVIFINSTEMMELIKKRTNAELEKLPDTVAGDIQITIEQKIDYIKSQKLRVLWVGSLSFRKNPDILFKLAREFRKKNLEFVICGSGSGKCADKFLSKVELFDNMIYRGSISKGELIQEYRKSDFVLFSSIRDGYTNVYTEAYENLTPCIVTTAMASAEFNNQYLKELVYDVNNFSSLVMKLDQLLINKFDSALGRCTLYRGYLETMISHHRRFDVRNRAEVLCKHLLYD